MNIECIKEKLVEAVSRAEKIAGKNPTLPVLAGLHIEAEGNLVTVRATNLDIGISITIPAKVETPGKVVLPAQTLGSFLNSLSKDKSVTLKGDGLVVEVNSGGSRASIRTLPIDDFPLIPEIEDDKAFTLPSKDLVIGLKSVVYAALVGSMKPELSAVSLAHEGENLVFAATDSFRLAEKKVKIKKLPHFNHLLIPQKNAAEIVRIFDSVDEEISISLSENQIALRAGNIYVVSRVIDGVFPNYRQLITETSSTQATILKQDFVSALKTSLVFSDAFNQLKLSLSPSKKQFIIESKNSNIGENIQNVASVLEGEDLMININHKYLADCFQSIHVDTVNLSFNGEARPVVVEGVGDKTFLYIVMPMNRS